MKYLVSCANFRQQRRNVAQVGNLLYPDWQPGKRSNLRHQRIANPQYSRLPVCATLVVDNIAPGHPWSALCVLVSL
jgi:hypothetical protein